MSKNLAATLAPSVNVPEGLPLARKAIWKVIWPRIRKFNGWSPTELEAFVDELQALVEKGVK